MCIRDRDNAEEDIILPDDIFEAPEYEYIINKMCIRDRYISEYIEYIESVFEVEAFEFIRKPISNEKFMLTLKRALNRLDRKQYFFD